MEITRKTVEVEGFEDLGTEVWELAEQASPLVHMCIVPGNPGSAGGSSRHREHLFDAERTGGYSQKIDRVPWSALKRVIKSNSDFLHG
jgi:hypothetical protein